ncbi:hypothetical protein VTN31DRAFT_222 [Thermomyces dupontii]|uniref:uncharacterized protein n=1 Tax=Talaromyces thermophilus TaxID=28565 RepID=UPI0037432E6F
MASPPSTMRAWLWTSTAGGLEKNLYLSDTVQRPGQTLQGNQILVKVQSAALNPADFAIPELGGWLYARFAVSTPATPGMDFAGEVVAVGPGVDEQTNNDVRVGQKVFGKLSPPVARGSLAEYIMTTADLVYPVPEGVDLDQVASVGVAGQTAYEALKEPTAALAPGDHVFINNGSGGVGVHAIQMAKILGCRVTVTCSTRNIELCKQLGADEVIDYTATDVIDVLKRQGRRYSLAIDNVGHAPASLYRESHNFLLPGKPFVQVGRGTVLTLLDRQLRPSLLGGGQRPFRFLMVGNSREQLRQIAEWLQQGKLRIPIDGAYAFEDVVKAFERLKTTRARGKIVIHVEPRK